MNGDQVTCPKILIFATGADQPPPLGFPEQGKIVFSPQILGTASTCEMTIFLPCQHKNYEFQRSYDRVHYGAWRIWSTINLFFLHI